ncbi:MAG TPA: PTS sugar transporter subunit IIB [Aquiluna sp.]
MLIYAVCGAGIGTSVLLKSNADRVLSDLGIEATVKAVAIEEAVSPDSMAQVLLITPELAAAASDIRSEVVVVKNIFDLSELTQKLSKALS